MTDALDLPEIVTPRLRLRALRHVDAEDLRRLTNDPAIVGAIDFLADPFGIRDAEALIAGKGDARDCFVGGRLVANGALATVCGAHLQGDDAVEIGYWVGRVYVGQGLAFEAVQALLATLRTHLPDRRLIAECRPENQASWHLLSKLGFAPTCEPGKRPERLRLAS